MGREGRGCCDLNSRRVTLMGHLSNGDKRNMLCYFQHAHDIALQWILHYPSLWRTGAIFMYMIWMGRERHGCSHLNDRDLCLRGPFKQQR